jgi:hypothetical protein
LISLLAVRHARAERNPESSPDKTQEPRREPDVSAEAPQPRAAAKPPSAADDDDDVSWNSGPPGIGLGFITLNVMLQARYRETFAARSDNPRSGYALREDAFIRRDDGFRIRRLYLRVRADPSPWFAARVVLNFARLDRGELKGVVRQAYGRISPLPDRIELAAGVLELPYSIMKMDSAASLELADRGEASELVTDLDYAGRDVGLSLMLAPLRKPKHLRLTLGVYRGHAHDENASPVGALGARLESKPLKGLRVGVSLMHEPYEQHYRQPLETDDDEVVPNPRDPLYPRERSWARGTAWGADISYHRKRFMLRGEAMLGDRVDIDERYGARVFYAAWALLAYRFEVGPVALLPAARAEWLDADADHSVGTRRTFTLAMNVILSEHLRLLVDVTHIDVDDDSPILNPPGPLPVTPYLDLDRTQATAQLQVQI